MEFDKKKDLFRGQGEFLKFYLIESFDCFECFSFVILTMYMQGSKEDVVLLLSLGSVRRGKLKIFCFATKLERLLCRFLTVAGRLNLLQ